MDIYLQDLSPQLQAQALRSKRLLRALKYLGTPVNAEQYDLPEETSRDYSLAAAGLLGLVSGVAADLFLRMAVSWPDLSLLGGCGTAIGVGLGCAGRRRAIHQRNRERITPAELSLLRKKEADALKLDYLSIIEALLALPSPNAVSAQSIRNSLRLLGGTIEGLPPAPAEALFRNPRELNSEAHAVAEAAQRETDAVVAASLQRQEAALTRRAETITRTATLVRRNQALRAEVTSQVKAIQTGLAAGRMNGGQFDSEFAALADHVAVIAQEATALSDARAELDAALAGVDSPVLPQSAKPSVPGVAAIQSLGSSKI